MKISMDYDGTLSTDKGFELAKKLINEGNTLYIISARNSIEGMLKKANELEIPHSRIYATGSNKSKIEKIKELEIDKHYDNNMDVIKELENIGHKFEKLNEIINHPKLSDDYKFEKIKEIFGFNELSIDEVYDYIKNEFKIWRSSPNSANVGKIMYNDETKELILQFRDKSIYTYYDVDFNLFTNILNGAGVCRTNGSNKWGSWEVGKTPSVGAAVYDKLVEAGIKYKRGGTLK